MRRRCSSTCGCTHSKDLELEVRCSGATDRRTAGVTKHMLLPPLWLIPIFRRSRAFSACSNHPETQQEYRAGVAQCTHSELKCVVMRIALNNTKATLVVSKTLTARADILDLHKRLPWVGLALVSRPCHIGQHPMSCVVLQGPGAGVCGMDIADRSPTAEDSKTV